MIQPTFYEFFAGGGMARAGLGPHWTCLFANDIDPKKGAAYRANWGDDALWIGDVGQVKADRLPGRADLAWASFPCQDLSLAGAGAGLNGNRSGTFWAFCDAMHSLKWQHRLPRMLVLENVCGTLTSHGGKDFAAIGRELRTLGYRWGALVIDAALFLPQSRPRLFIVAVRSDLHAPDELVGEGPSARWHPPGLRQTCENLPFDLRASWVWWRLPEPGGKVATLESLIEDEPSGVSWHSAEETAKIVGQMSRFNLRKLDEARQSGRKRVGAVYKRTRRDELDRKVQRAEVRFDDIAGCLRTPAGGSSRQIIMVVERERVRTRLLSPREAARLMGLPDSYGLPTNYNDAYHLAGDGVAVPVVAHLERHLLKSLLSPQEARAPAPVEAE